jgi:hypothetical protein
MPSYREEFIDLDLTLPSPSGEGFIFIVNGSSFDNRNSLPLSCSRT